MTNWWCLNVSSIGPDAERATDAGTAWSPKRKVALFASIFRGRQDVFPRRWERPGKGRSGWAPRCSNELVPGACAKPRVRCGECLHQAFVAPVEAELFAHPQGRQVDARKDAFVTSVIAS